LRSEGALVVVGQTKSLRRLDNGRTARNGPI
jgi:hypothetical protein